ncbi:hypothetical protein M8J77_009494 [Diaphorina citri]|nr:hypothetical protein M8J77_009494 [Diaphorina citri]
MNCSCFGVEFLKKKEEEEKKKKTKKKEKKEEEEKKKKTKKKKEEEDEEEKRVLESNSTRLSSHQSNRTSPLAKWHMQMTCLRSRRGQLKVKKVIGRSRRSLEGREGYRREITTEESDTFDIWIWKWLMTSGG